MRANGMVLWGLSFASFILAGSISAASTSAGNVAGEQAGQIHFSGKVVDADGSAIEGARVRFYTAYPQDATLAGEAVTGTDGTCSVAAPAKRDGYRYGYIIAEKGELALGLANWRMTEDEEVEIKLGPAKKLAGIVVDSRGKPISGVQTSVSMLQIGDAEQRRGLGGPVSEKLLTVITDGEGRFSFGRIPAGATAEFLVRKDGRATIGTFQRSAYSSKGYQYLAGRKDIKLVLPLESRIQGIVVEKATGRPVTNAKVMIADSTNRALPGVTTVVSNEDGTFSMDALPQGDHLVKYMPPDDGPVDWIAESTGVTLEAGKTATDVKVELTKGATLEVLVTDKESKESVEGVSVSVYDQRRRQSYGGKTSSDGVGRIRLLPGTYQSGHAYKSGFSSHRLRKPVTIADGATKRLEWKLTPLPTITGVVHDKNGKPIQGVSLRVLPMGGRDDVNSDADGRFKVSWDLGLFSDRRQAPHLVCRHVADNLGAVAIIPEGKRTLDIELRPAVIVRGKVVDPGGRAIANAGIRVMLRQTMWASTMTRGPVTTDVDGNFEVKAIPVEHRYQLNVNAEGYGGKRIEIHADDAVDSVLEIESAILPRANLAVSGVVVDTQGNPVANARIESYGFEDGQPDRLVTQCDSQGKFTLEGVCEGTVDLRVDVSQKGKRLSTRAKAYGGATGIKLVAREGRAVLQHFGTKSYEEILRGNEKAITGVALDESGSPVAGVPVGVQCHKTLRENGKHSWMFSSFSDLKATTDKQGRFAIPTEEDGEYNLLFSPDNHAAIIAYDIPVGKKDLKVTLPTGGTVTGRLMRMDRGKKVPIPNAEVKIESTDRASYTHLGFDRDHTALTDAQGKFRFDHVRTKIRPSRSMSQQQWSYIPRVWQISYGETSRTIEFGDNTKLLDIELVAGLDSAGARSLVGAPLPEFNIPEIDSAVDRAKGKMVLVCFFDMLQRPSRNCLSQLSAKQQELTAKNVAAVAVHASKIDQAILSKWCKAYSISFPVGIVQGDEAERRSAWEIQSLPWLILTDTRHTVTAAGFRLSELEEKIKAGK